MSCQRCNKTIIFDDLLKCNGPCGGSWHYTCLGIRLEAFTRAKASKTWNCISCREKATIKNKEPSSDDDIKTMLSNMMVEIMKIDTIVEKLDSIYIKVQDLEHRTNNLETENTTLKRSLNILGEKVDELEQRSRIANIEIKGIPMTPNEDCKMIVLDVAKAAGIQAQLGDIQVAHRIMASKNKQIVAQLSSRAIRIEWMKKFKGERNLNANKINRAFKDNPVFVNEHLTVRNKTLLQETKSFAKMNNFKFVWVNDNRILMRKTENSKILRIRDQTDLPEC